MKDIVSAKISRWMVSTSTPGREVQLYNPPLEAELYDARFAELAPAGAAKS